MSMTELRTTYTLTVLGTAVSFFRLTGGDFDRWFGFAPTYTKSKILRAAERRIVIDLGGDDYPQLTVRAVLASEAARTTVKGWAKQQGVLANTRGRTADVYVVSCAEPEIDSVAYYGRVLDIVFEKIV